MIKSKMILNEDVSLEALYTNSDSEEEILFIHGMGGNADTWRKDLEEFKDKKAVALSLRGRGNSDSPKAGYTFKNHIADVICCAREFNFKEPLIISNSAGAAWAIGYALEFPVKGLILIDHAAVQIPVDESWIKRVKEDKNSPFSEDCLNGIIKEFDFVNLYPELEKIKAPIVLLKGAKDGSHVEQEDIKDYESLCANFKTIVLPNSGHGISDADEVILWETIRDFYPLK